MCEVVSGIAIVVRKTGACSKQEYRADNIQRDYRRRLTNIYNRYAPDKMSGIDSVLVRYQGQEEALMTALVAKYGPEPFSGGSLSQQQSLIFEIVMLPYTQIIGNDREEQQTRIDVAEL